MTGTAETMVTRGMADVAGAATAGGPVEHSLERLGRWVEDHGYRAYDPGDGQLSFLRHLTFGAQKLERVLTAAVLRTPFNIRPLIGIRPHTSTKGMGYMAWGYLRRYRATGNPADAERARRCLAWLLEHRSPSYPDLCWGNDFTFTTRAGRIPRGEPTIVWSGLIGQAFIEAFETLGDRRYLDAADSVCDWMLKLPRERTPTGDCLSYVAFNQVSIHNSNMLGAALLARTGAITGRNDAIEVARSAMRYSCERQNPDGGWYYGEVEKYHWVDSFHTGYNLDSLKRYADSTGDRAFDLQLSRGYAYFKANFFEPDGRVRYMNDRLMPVDIQCLAQAIDTLALFSDTDPGALDLAQRVADWTIANMQAADGHMFYRDLGWTKIRTPMFHWGQGTTFKALAHLVEKKRTGTRARTAALAAAATAGAPEAAAAAAAPPMSYVLVTPARNEEAYIGGTIRSVIAQTRRPLRWVIVSDGSTDRTDEIVTAFAKEHDWIELLRLPERRDRQFAAKANAFNAGYQRLAGLSFDLVGNLDADITLPDDYYAFLLGRFADDPRLGVAGTPFVENADRPDDHTYAHDAANLEHVSGACQIFRRPCFEAVGGYVPIKGGAIDWIAVTTARMKGWKTRTFLERVCFHHRKIGTAESSAVKARFHYGTKAYYVGGHPAWELLRGVGQMRSSPVVVGGGAFMAGYLWAWITRMPRPVSAELMAFHRAEQMVRLKKLLRLG
jgi:GT2 family glycosyltransferase